MQNSELDFKPRNVRDIFLQLSRIPHSSGKEDQIRAFVIGLVQKFNLSQPARPVKIVHYHPLPADAGEANIILRRSGAPGKEKSRTVVLQAHLDMVCVPSEDIFPLELTCFRDESGREMLKAGGTSEKDGTTLGADDGIGVATALAIITDPDLDCGPLEVLLTVREETSLAGARELDVNWLEGDLFLNLDSEDYDIITYGSAGGGNVRYTWQPEVEEAGAGSVSLEIALWGLSGGHSGVNIHEGKGNALKIMSRALDYLGRARQVGFRLISFTTGNDKANAIPANARVLLAVGKAESEEAGDALREIMTCLAGEYRHADPGFRFEISKPAAFSGKKTFTGGASLDLVALLLQIPHGPLKMLPGPDEVVETSCNLAILQADVSSVVIDCSNRSSSTREMERLQERHQNIAGLCGIGMVMQLGHHSLDEVIPEENLKSANGYVVFHRLYPAWQPDKNSDLLAIASRVYAEVYGEGKFRKEVIHAGLECSWIIEKYLQAGRKADCIAIGPTVLTPHTWNERLDLGTVPSFYQCVLRIIRRVQS